MSDINLRDQALAKLALMLAELESTTDSYPRYIQRHSPAGHWTNAFQLEAEAVALLKQIGTQPPPVPTPTPVPTPNPSGLVGVYHGAYIDGATMARHYGPAYAYTVPYDTHAVVQTQWEKDAGKTLAITHHGSGSASTPFWDSNYAEHLGTFDEAYRRGMYPMLDCSTAAVYLGDITAGKYDQQALAWFKQFADWGKPWFFRLNVEMNWHNYNYARVPAQGTDAVQLQNFVASWRHLHDLAETVGFNRNASWHWAPNARAPWDGASTPFEAYYPGDAYVDWTGAVIYQQSKIISDGDWGYLSGPSYQACLAAAPSKPIMISEWSSYYEFTNSPRAGAGIDANKGDWLRHALAYVRDHQPAIRAMVIFNTGYVGAESNELETSIAAMAGYQIGIADPVYLGKQTAMATSGKVPVPAR